MAVFAVLLRQRSESSGHTEHFFLCAPEQRQLESPRQGASRKRTAMVFRPPFRCEVHRMKLGRHQRRDCARLRMLLFAWTRFEKLAWAFGPPARDENQIEYADLSLHPKAHITINIFRTATTDLNCAVSFRTDLGFSTINHNSLLLLALSFGRNFRCAAHCNFYKTSSDKRCQGRFLGFQIHMFESFVLEQVLQSVSNWRSQRKPISALPSDEWPLSQIDQLKRSGLMTAVTPGGPTEAAELTAKSRLIQAIDETIRRRKLTQLRAARRCGTDQPTLSKVLRGRMEKRDYRPAHGLAYRTRSHRRNSRTPV
jgi:predicted XRE-type DNA-binding protein